MTIARTPLKLILFGEYGVLEGGLAIAVAINKYGYLEKSNNPEKVVVIDKNEKEFDLTDILPKYKGYKIKIDAETGSCLGTSAAVSLLLSYSNSSKKTEEMVKNAINIEHLFHGKSSGVDVCSSFYGGVIAYRNSQTEKMKIDFSKYKIMIWFSGIKKSTKEICRNINREIFPKLAAVADKAYKLLKSSFSLEELYKLIREAQDLLEILGVCPAEMKAKIVELRKKGIESKVTGSGNGGYLITIVNKDCEIEGWENVEIDYDGFTLLENQ